MGIYKRGQIWWARFQIDGREIRVSTGCRSRKKALQVEARIRDQIALGNWGIIEHKPAPILGEFLTKSFVPWIKTAPISRSTAYTYAAGAKQLWKSKLAGLPMDTITSEHTTEYVADHLYMGNSTVNQGLIALRRALSLALEWGRITKKAPVTLLEIPRRERVLTYQEEEAYLAKCPETWRTICLLMLDCGLRPDEARTLRWESNFDWQRGTVRILSGKTKAARRTLVMSDRIKSALEGLERQETGFVFPSRSLKNKTGHISQGACNLWHRQALKESKVKPFEPYSLRHTCLTRMGEYTPLPTLKVIAGHTRIEMTMRYVHPERESIKAAFAESESRHKSRQRANMKVVGKSRKVK